MSNLIVAKNGQDMRQLPPKWRWVTIAEVLSALETGTRPKGGVHLITEGVPSISAEHIRSDGSFYYDNLRYIPREFYSQMKRGHIKRHDSLIVKDGATTGKVAFIDDSFPFKEAVINEHVFICRPNPDLINPYFLFLWLSSQEGQNAIRVCYKGAAIGGINQQFSKTTKLPLPPLSEQERIIKIIGNQFSAFNRARAATQVQVEAVRMLPAAILKQVFCGVDSRGWPQTAVGNISSLIIDGPHVTPTYESKGIPFLTVRNIVNKRIDLSDVSYISESDHAQFSKRGKPEPGDILYTKDGTMGVPCIVERKFEFSFFVSVALIKPIREKVDPVFLFYQLQSPHILKQVDQLAAGAGLKHMVLKSINALEVFLPPVTEQKRISAKLKAMFSGAERLCNAIEENLVTTNQLHHSFLRQAFNGEI